MKSAHYVLTMLLASPAMAGLLDEKPFYPQAGYSLERVPQENRTTVLAMLRSNKEFKRMQGLWRSCEPIYRLADSAGKSVGYGSICKTSYENLKGFFCWDATGQYIAYARKPYGAEITWIGDSILHGCGGVLVRDTTYRTDNAASVDEWIMPELGLGKRRPVLSMLKSDIERLGFEIPLGACDKIRFRWLGRGKNTSYGAICEIDESGKQALICFDHFIGHFSLLTRYQDASDWAEHTIYRFCWGG